jgi:flagellar protein FlaF
MRHPSQAYQAVARQTASPRELEANLLLRAAARLQAIRDGWQHEHSRLDEALTFNRKLWSVFLTSVTNADNPLPRQIRQNIANLGVFVMTQTMMLGASPNPDRLAALISINRDIAAGLMART